MFTLSEYVGLLPEARRVDGEIVQRYGEPYCVASLALLSMPYRGVFIVPSNVLSVGMDGFRYRTGLVKVSLNDLKVLEGIIAGAPEPVCPAGYRFNKPKSSGYRFSTPPFFHRGLAKLVKEGYAGILDKTGNYYSAFGVVNDLLFHPKCVNLKQMEVLFCVPEVAALIQ